MDSKLRSNGDRWEGRTLGNGRKGEKEKRRQGCKGDAGDVEGARAKVDAK